MVRSMPRRPATSLCLLWASAVLFSQSLLPTNFTVAPSLEVTRATDAMHGWLTRPLQPAQGLADTSRSRVPRASLASGLAHTMVPFSIYAAMWRGLQSLLRAPARTEEKGAWDRRRIWTVLNVGNHGIYALLFLIRSLCYTGVGGNDRPFFFESFFLGWLCGPSWLMPSMLGWDNAMYNQPAVLKWVTGINSAQSTVFPDLIAKFVGSPAFMYFYQIAEGTFHLMICAGGLRAFFDSSWPPKKGGDSMQRLYRWGLWLEILVMDVAYVAAYSCLPMASCPGHWGLTTIMMLIHHVNVVPDIMCAWYEWKADQAAKEESRKLQRA